MSADRQGVGWAMMRPLEWVRITDGFLIGFELSIGISLVVLVPFTWIARPDFMGGPGPDTTITDAAALLMAVFGLLWMVRIARADPERDGDHWRRR
jgi:hypothetical protein